MPTEPKRGDITAKEFGVVFSREREIAVSYFITPFSPSRMCSWLAPRLRRSSILDGCAAA
jgi:hypothetical protein